MTREETWERLVELEVVKGEMPSDKWTLGMAELSDADLRGTDLRGAGLSNAKLNGAKFRGSNLSRANLFAADLKGANLRGANLSGADLFGAILSEADLFQADLGGARLLGANLINANLRGAYLHEASLENANLHGANLRRADLKGANLKGANLSEADLSDTVLRKAYLTGVDLRGADLSGTNLYRAELFNANVSSANLNEANLREANLTEVNLKESNLSGADLRGATLISTNVEGTNFSGCNIFGVSAWKLKLSKYTQQSDLVISDIFEPIITVDNIEVAQFVYLLLNNEKVRDVLDTVTSRMILILGRFTEERKSVLDSIKNAIRDHGYVPILFDFQPSSKRSITETIQLLANMAKFVIADLTDAKSIPQELSHIIPNFPSVPVQPIILSSQRKYGMFEHWKGFNSVLPDFQYKNERHLIDNLEDKVMKPVEAWEGKKDRVSALEEEIKELKSKLAQKERGD